VVSKKSKSNIKLIEKLLNQNLKGINFFHTVYISAQLPAQQT
jgi:hypothetical protein